VNGDGEVAQQVRDLIAAEPSGPAPAEGTAGKLDRLCRAAARALPASGVAVTLMTGNRDLARVAASDATSVLLEELQFTLGEGPCVDACATGQVVLISNLTEEGVRRWPGYTPAAVTQGVRAVFALPLQVGAARLGVLDLFRDRPEGLSAPALAQALAFAQVATVTVLDGQAEAPAGTTPTGLDDALESRFHVHQAQGMVMVQLGVSLAEALVRLRAFAYSHDRRIGDVARDVVDRKLTLARDAG
jgi:hypothetical protein